MGQTDRRKDGLQNDALPLSARRGERTTPASETVIVS